MKVGNASAKSCCLESARVRPGSVDDGEARVRAAHVADQNLRLAAQSAAPSRKDEYRSSPSPATDGAQETRPRQQSLIDLFFRGQPVLDLVTGAKPRDSDLK